MEKSLKRPNRIRPTIQLTLPADLKARLEDKSEKTGIPISRMLTEAANVYLQELEAKEAAYAAVKAQSANGENK